jgi:hypothetical protein
MRIGCVPVFRRGLADRMVVFVACHFAPVGWW